MSNRLDEGADIEASAIIERVPEGSIEVIKSFGLVVQRQHVLTAYTDLMGRANGNCGDGVEAAIAIRDGVAHRIGTKVAGLSEGEVSPKAVLEWLMSAPPTKYELAKAQTLVLVESLLKSAQARGLKTDATT